MNPVSARVATLGGALHGGDRLRRRSRKTARPVWFGPMAIVAALSLACRVSGGAGQRPPEIARTSAPTGSPSATQTPASGPKPPPAGLIEAIQAGVDAGEWSLGEGLLHGLRIFTGESQPEEAFPETPAFLEGFGLVREAQRYAREGEDPVLRQEIAERLDRLGPTSDRLLEYAEAAPTSWAPPKVASLSSAPEDCASLFGSYSAEGFPPGTGIKCLLYKEGGVGGQTIRVYWPIAFVSNTDYADAAYTGILQAWQAYSKLKPAGGPAQMKGVDLLFMILPDVEDPQVLAMVPSASTDDRCLINVYLGAIQANEQAQATDDDYGYFLQTIAHEMFHCFQVWNHPALADDNWSVQDWWGEGTAEYFSNVVYPTVNSEWRWMTNWLENTATDSILEESYANFGFFQYVGNKLGNNGLLGLINHMNPAVGDDLDAQAVQLAAFPNIQTLFAEYARDFMDGKIVDTGGKSYPTAPPFIHPAYQVDVSQTVATTLDAAPFTLIRYRLTFAPGKEYQVTLTDKGGSGARTSRTVLPSGPWGDLPASVKAACGPTEYYLVMTTTQPASAPYQVALQVTLGDAVGCDTCLVGTWDLNVPSYVEYSEAPFAETPGFHTLDSAGGLWRYRFRADGTFRAEFDFFSSSTLHQPGGGFGADIDVTQVITIVGPGEGTYLSDGLSNLTFTLVEDNVNLSSTTTMNGADLGDMFDALSGYGFLKASDSMVYSCDPEAGILQLDVAPQAGLPPLQFDRISTDPSKP